MQITSNATPADFAAATVAATDCSNLWGLLKIVVIKAATRGVALFTAPPFLL